MNYQTNPFQAAVEDFHEATGQGYMIDTPEGRALRAKLIMEEAVETVAALGFDVDAHIMDPTITRLGNDGPDADIVGDFYKRYDEYHPLDYIDGLCDLTYVVMGGAVNAGINLQPHFDEVHAANMRKLAGPKREDGKQLKPEGWVGPDHQKVLDNINGANRE